MSANWDDLEAFCLFLGFARSGHSLVGALLDAHPDAVVAHEHHALRRLAEGASREVLFGGLLDRSRGFAAAGSRWNGYSYAVPGAWQGRVRRLRVLGDKKGGGSAGLLARRPEMLDRLRRTVGVPLRVIHVVRHPLDNVASIASRQGRPLEEALDVYLRRCRILERLLPALAPDEVHVVRHEDFIADPAGELGRLVDFLGLEVEPGYLEACAGIVFPAPLETRGRVAWTPAGRRRLRRGVAGMASLSGYRLER